MLNEISPTEKDVYCVISHLESGKKLNSQKQRAKWRFQGLGGGGDG